MSEAVKIDHEGTKVTKVTKKEGRVFGPFQYDRPRSGHRETSIEGRPRTGLFVLLRDLRAFVVKL